jgi:chemotaxis signal transduction protein
LLVEAQNGEVVGLMVDEVRHVARLSDGEIEVASNLLGGDVSEHVVGVGRPSGEVVVLLNLSSLVSG